MLIQVGVTGMRGPDGKIKENVPIYKEIENTVAENKEKIVCSDLAEVFFRAFQKHEETKKHFERVRSLRKEKAETKVVRKND